jgi:hypothetical protein
VTCTLYTPVRPFMQGVLVVGDNMIAVEVHQGGATSADSVFDMNVAYKPVRRARCPPVTCACML